MPTHFLLKRWVGVWLHVRGRLPQTHAYDDEDDDDADGDDDLPQSLRFDIWHVLKVS